MNNHIIAFGLTFLSGCCLGFGGSAKWYANRCKKAIDNLDYDSIILCSSEVTKYTRLVYHKVFGDYGFNDYLLVVLFCSICCIILAVYFYMNYYRALVANHSILDAKR